MLTGCDDSITPEENGPLGLIVYNVTHEEDKGYGGDNCPILKLPGVIDVQDSLDPYGGDIIGSYVMIRNYYRLLYVLVEEDYVKSVMDDYFSVYTHYSLFHLVFVTRTDLILPASAR